MFKNLKALVIKEHETKKARVLARIEESEEYLKEYSTARRWEQYTGGEIDRAQAIAYAQKRAAKEYEKRTAKDLEKLELAEIEPDAKSVSISVEWKRSSIWGYNPHAEVIINDWWSYTGTASGCGYDKETAAVGNALNQSHIIKRMLYKCKEKALENGYNPENGKGYSGIESNAECINYGAGYGTLPYFEGGVGMSSFEGVFNACGLRLVSRHSTKHSDYYYFERKEG